MVALNKFTEFYDSIDAKFWVARGGKGFPNDPAWQRKGVTFAEAVNIIESSNGQFDKVAHILDPTWLVIDVDTEKGGHKEGFPALAKIEEKLGSCLDDFCEMIVESPSGGLHYLFRKPSYLKVSKNIDGFDGIDFLTSTLNAEGLPKAQCVISAGSKHKTFDGEYTLIKQGVPAQVPDKLVEILMEAMQEAAAAKEVAKAPQLAPVLAPSANVGQKSGDAFNKSPAGLQIMIDALQKAQYTVWQKNDCYFWKHPAASSGHECSGTVGNVSNDGNYMLFAWTTSTVFPADESMTIFKAFATFCHNGDMRAAASELYDLGFGDKQDSEIDLSKFDFSFIDRELGITVTPSSLDQSAPDMVGFEEPKAAEIKEGDTEKGIRQLPDELIYDDYLLGDLTRWVESRQTYKMPELALGAALHILGLATARRWMGGKYDKKKTCTNLYVLSVAPTGSGKETPRTCIKEFMMKAGHEKLTGIEKLSSAAGLEWQLSQNPTCPLIPDEIGDLVKVMCNRNSASYMQQIAPTLKTLFTSSNSEICKISSRVNEEPITVRYPYLSLMGSTTPGMLFNSLSSDKVEDGLIGRFTMLHGELTKEMIDEVYDNDDEDDGEAAEAPDKCIRGWKFLRGDVAPTGHQIIPSIANIQLVMDGTDEGDTVQAVDNLDWQRIPRSKEAFKRMKEHSREIGKKNLDHAKNGEGVEQAIWSRQTEKTAKLAMLFALSRYAYDSFGEPEITLDDMNRAIKLSNALTRRFIASVKSSVHDNEFEEQMIEFLRVLHKHQKKAGGKGVAKSKLLKVKPLNKLKADGKLDNFIELLQQSHMIVTGKSQHGHSFALSEDGLKRLNGED